MKNNILLAIAFAGALTAACNNNTADGSRTNGYSDTPVSKEDSLDKAIMDGHDAAMAKMNPIRKYLAQIQQQKDSQSKLPASQQDKNYLQTLTELEKDLNTAQNNMNTWMDAYVIDSAKDNKELRIKYLESEKAKVDTIKKLMFESVQRADSLLKGH